MMEATGVPMIHSHAFCLRYIPCVTYHTVDDRQGCFGWRCIGSLRFEKARGQIPGARFWTKDVLGVGWSPPGRSQVSFDAQLGRPASPWCACDCQRHRHRPSANMTRGALQNIAPHHAVRCGSNVVRQCSPLNIGPTTQYLRRKRYAANHWFIKMPCAKSPMLCVWSPLEEIYVVESRAASAAYPIEAVNPVYLT